MCNINIENPMSVEEFERTHTALVGAIENAVRRELDASRADGLSSENVQCSFDLCKIASDGHLVFRDSLNRISQCDDCPIRVTSGCAHLGIFSRINRFPIHMITSLLVVGGIIVASLALGVWREKRNQ